MPIDDALLKSYIAATRSMTAKLLRKELRELRDRAPELAGAACAELAARGEPEEEPATQEAPQGFHFAPATSPDDRSTIEIWHGRQLAATIYAQRGGMHIVFAPGYEPGPLAVEVQLPFGVQIAIERGGRA